MADLTIKTEELVKQWQAASKQAAAFRESLEKAGRELQIAEEQLAIWLLPKDAKEDETFCVWYGDSLISARELTNGYEVSVRKRGESLMV